MTPYFHLGASNIVRSLIPSPPLPAERCSSRRPDKRLLPAVALLAAALLAGCSQGGNLPPLETSDAMTYRLGAGDQIRIITYDEPQLTNTFSVGAKGKIDFPLLGPLDVAGQTTGELASTISTQLQQGKIMVHPSVSVEVLQYRPIFVLGEVTHPGQYPYQPGMTLLSAVALAGGFTYRAVTDYASDVRNEGRTDGKATEGKIGRASFLQPGDVITIYERYF